MLERVWRKKNPYTLLLGMLLGSSMEVPQKAKK